MIDPTIASTNIPEVQAKDLCNLKCAPSVPFRIICADGKAIALTHVLRFLPGKRIVGEAECEGQRVLAKLFVAEHGQRHWMREKQGLEFLHARGIATPEVLFAGKLQGTGFVLLSEFLQDACTLAERWESLGAVRVDEPRALNVLQPALALLGRLHAAGLIQSDLHLGNFLVCREKLFVIDGDGINTMADDTKRSEQQAMDNLGLLITQLPLVWETRLDTLLDAYQSEQERFRPDMDSVQQAVERARKKRLTHFLSKTLRDCSQFAVRKTARQFSVVLRNEQGNLSTLLDNPDHAIEQGQILKDGGTCTVVRVEVAGRPLVIKRYNIKNFRHAVSRFWRPSRAWHSWLAGQRLAFYGIATPMPLAMLEERFVLLRQRAFLVTEFCPGQNLLKHLLPDREPDEREATAIIEFFQTLFRLRISHGDMKATNFLWHSRQLFLIDLDAMIAHRNHAIFVRHWRRDRERFLRNWPEQSVLHRWLKTNLP